MDVSRIIDTRLGSPTFRFDKSKHVDKIHLIASHMKPMQANSFQIHYLLDGFTI